MRPGDEIKLRFELLATPSRPLDTAAHLRNRHTQVGYPSPLLMDPAAVAARGARVVGLHQGVEGGVLPHINWPFMPWPARRLEAYTRAARAAGVKAKMYYTLRELSSHTAELWPLRSLGEEVLTAGGGGGSQWLRRHLSAAPYQARSRALLDDVPARVLCYCCARACVLTVSRALADSVRGIRRARAGVLADTAQSLLRRRRA
eukprot:5618976-Prymnesium_polylepis.5